MSHLAHTYANNGGGGGSGQTSYYEQQPPHIQHQQQQAQAQAQAQQRAMPPAAVGGAASHYSLGPYQQVAMQQPLSHKQPSPIPSPYRQVQPMQPNTQILGPPHHSPYTQQQPPHMMHQHPTRPIASSGASFKRELFPHEMTQQQQPQQPHHRQSSFVGLSGVPGSKDGANISPPPGSDEFFFHEANVRSLTETPSPPLPMQQNHPPEQVAHMLSQIIKKQQAALGGGAGGGQGQGQQPQQQQHSSQHQQMLAQQQAAQQQAQRAELYNHFQSSGYKPASAGLHPHQQQQQNHYASPAASIQLSQSQAHSAHTQLASAHYNRAQAADAMRPPQQQNYYEQTQPQAQHGGPYSTHMHQQQPQQPQGSPYGSVHSKSSVGGGGGVGLSASQQAQQHSPSQIPGMSNVVDPEYIRMLKRRQAELIEMQQQEQMRAAQIRLQQQQQQQQQHGGGMQMHQQQLSQVDHHQHSQQQHHQAFAPASSLSAPIALHDPYAAQAPPPLQGRSQSLPSADQYGQIGHSSNLPTAHGYYTEQSLQQQQPQYRSDGYAQQPSQPPGGLPLHAYSNNGASVLPPHLQQQHQSLHMHSQQPQQQQLPYSSAGSVPPSVGVAAPPGFKADPSSGNSPPQHQRQQQQQYQQQSQQQLQPPSRYEQMQQLKQIVGNVNNAAEADFRGAAASPNFGSNTTINSNVASVHYPPPSSSGSGAGTGRVPSAPYPRRSQSLGDPNAGMGVGAPPPPVSHEAVPISLGGRRGAAASGGAGEGAEGGGERGRVVAAANLSRFSAGPPNQDSRGFVARCCTEARRGGRGGQHLSPSAANSVSSSAAPAGSAGSSVLTRASFGTRRASKDYTQPGGGSSYVPLNQYNPFSNLSSSPDLESSPSPSSASTNGDRDRPSAATWGPRDGSGGAGSKPAPLSMGGGSGSGQTTPCQSPTTKQHPAPRARMQTPLLPPTPK